MSVGIRWCLLLVIFSVLVCGQTSRKRAVDSSSKLQLSDDVIESDRKTRQSSVSKVISKPVGFFGALGTIKQLIFEQANDTKSAYTQLNTLFSGQFSDGPQPSTTKAPITDNSTTTTEGPPRISRAEFLRILDRNLKGLRRLYNLELREASKDSRKNIQEYKREFNQKLYEQFAD